jgi:hypothetical protein
VTKHKFGFLSNDDYFKKWVDAIENACSPYDN